MFWLVNGKSKIVLGKHCSADRCSGRFYWLNTINSKVSFQQTTLFTP